MVSFDGLVSLERRGEVAILTLTRPGKLNAISSKMEGALQESLSHPDLVASRCVVVSGGPRVFSAGADVNEMRAVDADAVFCYYRRTGSVYEAVADLSQPSISAISGYCLGGGLELALATDFRVVDETAVLGLPELDIGIVPSSGGIYRLVRSCGVAVAREVVLLRRRLTASEALTAGLVTEVVPAGTGLERAVELACSLSERPALAMSLAKRAIDAAAESSRAGALLIEQLSYAALVQGAESQRRIGSFGER